jgi:hypothetical protein
VLWKGAGAARRKRDRHVPGPRGGEGADRAGEGVGSWWQAAQFTSAQRGRAQHARLQRQEEHLKSSQRLRAQRLVLYRLVLCTAPAGAVVAGCKAAGAVQRQREGVAGLRNCGRGEDCADREGEGVGLVWRKDAEFRWAATAAHAQLLR